MDNLIGQTGRPILGRASISPQGDSQTQPVAANYGSVPAQTTETNNVFAAANVQSGQKLSEALEQQCAITQSNQAETSGCKVPVVTDSDNVSQSKTGATWNVKASDFVPGASISTHQQTPLVSDVCLASSGPVHSTTVNSTAGDYEFSAEEVAFCNELDCALERLAKAPGSFAEESTYIISLLNTYVLNAKLGEYAANSIVQCAIEYRSFTYDAASLCQLIATAFRRELDSRKSTFRDFLLKVVHKEYQQLDAYLHEGNRDRQSASDQYTEKSGSESWAPHDYRVYVNGLVQFIGFLFMNLRSHQTNKRILLIGRSVRSSLLKLLLAIDVEYLDTVLIVVKECGCAVFELEDEQNEWTRIVDILDRILLNCRSGALLISPADVPAKNITAAPVANGDVPSLYISGPLRNQLRRFVDQARSWTRAAPSSAAVQVITPSVPSLLPASELVSHTEVQSGAFEFDPDTIDESYINALPTGIDSIPSAVIGDVDDQDDVDDAYEKFAATQRENADGDEHPIIQADDAQQRNEAPDEDYDAEYDSFLATIPKQDCSNGSKPSG